MVEVLEQDDVGVCLQSFELLVYCVGSDVYGCGCVGEIVMVGGFDESVQCEEWEDGIYEFSFFINRLQKGLFFIC